MRFNTNAMHNLKRNNKRDRVVMAEERYKANEDVFLRAKSEATVVLELMGERRRQVSEKLTP